MTKHFAKIGTNSKVIEVVAIEDSLCLDSDGNHNEIIGLYLG